MKVVVGIDSFYQITKETQTLQEAMKPSIARENMINTVEQVFLSINL